MPTPTGRISVAGIPGQIGLGHLSDRIRREWVWTIGCLGFALCYGALILLRDTPTPPLLALMLDRGPTVGADLAPSADRIAVQPSRSASSVRVATSEIATITDNGPVPAARPHRDGPELGPSHDQQARVRSRTHRPSADASLAHRVPAAPGASRHRRGATVHAGLEAATEDHHVLRAGPASTRYHSPGGNRDLVEVAQQATQVRAAEVGELGKGRSARSRPSARALHVMFHHPPGRAPQRSRSRPPSWAGRSSGQNSRAPSSSTTGRAPGMAPANQ